MTKEPKEKQVLIRVPHEMHQRMSIAATLDECSIKELVERAIGIYLDTRPDNEATEGFLSAIATLPDLQPPEDQPPTA